MWTNYHNHDINNHIYNILNYHHNRTFNNNIDNNKHYYHCTTNNISHNDRISRLLVVMVQLRRARGECLRWFSFLREKRG